jgi:hypothetical protein
MNKIAIALVATSAMFIVGCSSNASPAPTVTVTQNAPAPEPLSTDDGVSNLSNEELYLLGIKSMNNPILNAATDSQLLEMGYSVCEALNAGFTVDDVIQYMATQMVGEGMTSDVETEAVGYIIGAADSALCPGSNTF